MEVLLGLTGKDFTLIAASKAAMRGVSILKATDDKTRELNKFNLMADFRKRVYHHLGVPLPKWLVDSSDDEEMEEDDDDDHSMGSR